MSIVQTVETTSVLLVQFGLMSFNYFKLRGLEISINRMCGLVHQVSIQIGQTTL